MRAEHDERVELKHRGDPDRVASHGDVVPTRDADSTEAKGSDDKDHLTPLDQGNGDADLKLTQKIRQAVMDDDSLSFGAKNVKIITKGGHVTLRGEVNTAAEKTAIYKAAAIQAGPARVTNEIEIDN
jgi:osmotically-inducible protein OsmY